LRLPDIVASYCRSRVIPDWMKRRLKRLLNRNAQFPPFMQRQASE